MKTEKLSDYYTPREFAEHFNLHPETVRQKCRERKLGIKIFGCWRIHKSAVYTLEN